MDEDDKPFVAPLYGDGPLTRHLFKEWQAHGYNLDEIPWRDEVVEARYYDWQRGRGR